MELHWVYLTFVCLSLTISNQSCLGERIRLSSDSETTESRLKKELDDLYALAEANIQANHLNLTTKNAFEIIEELVLSNATGLTLNSSSCPRLSGAHGIYTIKVDNLEPFPVFCDSEIAGPGWTVIARRTNDKENFFLNWQRYKEGFGNLNSDFFIGLEKLHAITKSQPHELYIHLEDFEGEKRYANYDDFLIESENEFYRMSKLGQFTGDAGNSLNRNKNQKFSTYDIENSPSGNCAVAKMGAWWYKDCTDSNLFGQYLNGKYSPDMGYKGVFWSSWRGYTYSHKTMQMMIRPKCTCS